MFSVLRNNFFTFTALKANRMSFTSFRIKVGRAGRVDDEVKVAGMGSGGEVAGILSSLSKIFPLDEGEGVIEGLDTLLVCAV